MVALMVMVPPEDEVPTPLTAERVLRRSLVLAAVVARGFLERGAIPEEVGDLGRLLWWLELHGLWDEVEPEERALLRTGLGQAERQDVVNATWRSEGLAVLSWALGWTELPAHDVSVDAGRVSLDLGLFAPVLPARAAHPALRSQEAIQALAGRLLGLHWRLRDFSLRPGPLDFRAFAERCWFGSFDLADVRLVDQDLAIGEVAISAASPAERARVSSIARERHQAINWLRGQHALYSEVDTST
jgi:hypothetical protein